MLEQILTLVIPSAGLTSGIFGIVLTAAIRKAKKDADIKREERLRLEILRLEGEERVRELLIAMVRCVKGTGSEYELDLAEKSYLEYLENCKTLKNEIIGTHTLK